MKKITINERKFDGTKYRIDKEASSKITGYASIDRPWLQFYHEVKDEIDTDVNCYEYFKKITQKYENMILITYKNRKYSRKDIIFEVEKYIQKFTSMGISTGDKISFIMLDTPEIIFMWLALSSIGAVANLIKFDESKERIKKIIEETKSKYLFITESSLIMGNALLELNNCQFLEEIISVPIYTQLDKLYEIKKLLISKKNLKEQMQELDKETKKIKKLKERYKVISYNSWMRKKYKKTKSNYDSNNVSVIVYTGGSTGTTKGVKLTNKNINSSAHGFIYGEYGFNPGKKSMNILPPAIAYYFNATYCLMCCGVTVDMIPFFKLDDYPRLIKEHMPNIFLSGPILFKSMMESNILKDLSFITDPISGGDKFPLSEEIKFTNYLHEHGSRAIAHQGYGESECTAAATYLKTSAAKPGSIGIPFINVNVAIFDSDTCEEVPYGSKNVGEICISGDTVMEGYNNNIEETNKVLIKHKDGKIWLHTEDYGYMDSDGRIYHCGRAKRMLTRNGAKVWLNAIEEVISRHPSVIDCCCVKAEDSIDREVPVCHIILRENPNYQKIIKELEILLRNELPESNIPKYYIIKDHLPYTEVNKKKDFKSMENEDIFDDKNYKIIENIIIPRSFSKKLVN